MEHPFRGPVPRRIVGTAEGAGRTQLGLLGSFRLERDGVPLPVPVGCQRLMALLGLRGRLSRTVAAGLLWPEVSDDRARACLRTALWRLRRIDVPLVDVRADALAPAESVDTDVRFLVGRSRTLIERPVDGPDLRALVEMSGELLPGWYEDWVVVERERLRLVRLGALETIGVELTRLGLHDRAVEVGLEAVRQDPLRESAYRVLIAAHLGQANVAEAVRCYRAFRTLLHDNLGIEPSPAVLEMIMRRSSPQAAVV